MASLKNNIQNLSGDTETLVRDYLKLFSVRQSEKLAIFLGILMSIFVIATLILILVIFCSFILAGALNDILASNFWGFVIVGSLYLGAIIYLIIKIFRTSTPLFTNIFVKLIILVMDIDTVQAQNVKELRKEQEYIRGKIDMDKSQIEADYNILRSNIMGTIMKELLGIFTSKKKTKSSSAEEQAQQEDVPDQED